MNQANGYFHGCAGARIFWQSWQPAEPLAVVVICHGLGEHGGRYAPLAEALVAKRCAVYAIDHRGHGHSYGHRGAIDRYQYTIDDLDQLVQKVEGQHAGLPIILFGHSMGGAIAVGYTLQYGPRLSALMLSGAALSAALVPGPMRAVGGLLAKLAPNLPAVAVAPERVSRDPEMVADYRQDPLNLSGRVPLNTIAEMVNAIAQLPRRFAELQLPMLVMHGSEDQLIPASSSAALIEVCGSEDKTLKVYDGLFHEILNELPADRLRVIEDICQWLQARFF